MGINYSTFEIVTNEEAVTSDEEAESDPMTGAAVVGAEKNLKDVAARDYTTPEVKEDEDTFNGTHFDVEELKDGSDEVKVVVNDDGELFLQAKGASSLAASVFTLLAVTSIIY